MSASSPNCQVQYPDLVADLFGARCFRRDGKIVIEIPDHAVVDAAENTDPGFVYPRKIDDRDAFLNEVVDHLRARSEEVHDDCSVSPILGAVWRAIRVAAPRADEGPSLWELHGPGA